MELHLFDFDGTIFKSPEYTPDWWNAPGEWSWLSHPLSLTDPCVPLNPPSEWWIKSSIKDAKASTRNRNAITIICTGRVQPHEPRIRSLLKKAGITNLDGVFFNPGISAAIFKTQVIEDLHNKYDFEAVHIWENENYHHYKNFVETKLGIPCVIHAVNDEHHDFQCTPKDIRLDGEDTNIFDEREILSPKSLKYARQNREIIEVVRVDDDEGVSNEATHVVVLLVNGKEVGFVEGKFDLHFFDEINEFVCSEDIMELYDLWVDDVRGIPSGAWDLQIPVFEVLESNINIDYRGKGLGVQMYKELANQVREEVGYPIFFIPNYCNKRSTSSMARRVWKSLAKSNPQSSGDVILMIDRKLR